MSSKSATQSKRRAIFLDRDGTIIREIAGQYLTEVRGLRLLPKAALAIRKMNELGFLTVIVTNQGGIAKGLMTEKRLDEIHGLLIDRLSKDSAYIDAIYYCPHHPQGKIKGYAMQCRCRKPEIGMIIEAVKSHNIDLKKSYIIGDRTMDILAGERAKITTILLKTGASGKDGKWVIKPDFVANDLLRAVAIIKQIEKKDEKK